MLSCLIACLPSRKVVFPQDYMWLQSLQRGSINELSNGPGLQRSSENVLAARASALLGYLGGPTALGSVQMALIEFKM